MEAVQRGCYVRVIGDKPPVDVTHTNKRATLCEYTRVFHVVKTFDACLCYTALVRRDSLAEGILL